MESDLKTIIERAYKFGDFIEDHKQDSDQTYKHGIEVVLDQVEKMESEEIDAKEIIAILLSYKERYCISV